LQKQPKSLHVCASPLIL